MPERDGHVASTCARIIKELDGRPVDLIVLPELSTIEYSRAAFEQLDELAETETGPSAQAFAELADRTGAAVLFGYPRRSDDGYRISQQLVRPDGSDGAVFDKIHMAQFGASMEKEFFGRGQRLCVS